MVSRFGDAVASWLKLNTRCPSSHTEHVPSKATTAVPSPEECFQRLFDRLETVPPPKPSTSYHPVVGRTSSCNPFDTQPEGASGGTPVGLPCNPFGEATLDGIRVVPMGSMLHSDEASSTPAEIASRIRNRAL